MSALAGVAARGDCGVMARPVWIDLANSPHVLFFRPVIDELHRRGIATHCTARDFAQTPAAVQSARHRRRGRSGVTAAPGIVGKATLSGRTGSALYGRSLVASRPSVAVSHNSYAQLVAARSLRVAAVTAMDYEYQPANHLAFRCADLIAVPDTYSHWTA